MVDSVRTRRAFSALSRSRDRGRSGPVWVVRTDAPTDGEQDVPDRAQVAYAVGKGVGRSVVRNRVRRRLRPLMDDLERDGSLLPGLYLVGVTASAPASSFADLREHLSRAVADASATAPAGAR